MSSSSLAPLAIRLLPEISGDTWLASLTGREAGFQNNFASPFPSQTSSQEMTQLVRTRSAIVP